MKFTLSIIATLISFQSFALTFTADVPKAVKEQLLSDLNFVQTIKAKGVTPLHSEIFGAVDGSSYKTFFETRMKKVGMGCGGGKAVACVKPFFSNTTMFLTENYIKFSHPAIARLMVVFHEARHGESENGNWSHAVCPTPFVDENGKEIISIWTGATLAGEDACDVTPKGSYGSSTIMLKNVAKFCENCNEKVKMDADLYAMDQLNRISEPKVKEQMKADFKTALRVRIK